MSDVLETCWHGQISKEEAENRLRASNKTNAYLFRESDIKRRRFLLSYISDKDRGLFKHVFVPNPSARKAYSSVSEASDVMGRMVLTSDHCRHPVCPLPPDPDENGNFGDMSTDDSPASDHACHACGFVCEGKEKLQIHHKTHFVIECDTCLKFIGKNSFTAHSQKCKNIPRKEHACDECDYKTHWPKCLREHKKRVHEMGGYPCGTCRKVFDSQENLIRHREIHAGGDFPCPDCPKTFKLLKSRNKHQRLHHSMIRSDFGFFILEPGQVNTTVKKKAGFDCIEQGCDKHFERRRELDRHISRAHGEVSSSPRKTYKCDGCPHISQDSSNFRRHLHSCDKHIAKHPRIVPLLTKEAVIKIHKKSAISDAKYLALLKDIQEETGALLMEGNLKKEIQESINSFEEFYEVEQVDIEDKHGKMMVSSLAWVKKLPELIQHIIEKNNIKEPRVVIGGDSGQGKFIFTLSVFDMSDLSKDFWGYSRAGRRRTLVIAASDEMDENHYNINLVVSKLKLWELEDLDWILSGDQKFANICFGVQCHTCHHNCIYCEGCKMDENGNKTNSVDADWFPGVYRTPAINKSRQTFWLCVCGHLKGKRDRLSNFKNVEFPHIPLPRGWEHVKIIFLLPPDPLHVILLGPIQDMFNALKVLYPGIMTAFFRRCGIGRRRSMVAGNFTGVELKMLLREKSLADLAQIIEHGVEVTQYLRSGRELHKMCVKKDYSPDHQDYIDDFETNFKVMRELKMVSFTTKVHIILHHIGFYMSETKLSLYTADASPQESTHSGLMNTQRIHNLLSTHQIGSPGQQLRLKMSLMRHNWKNLSFDLRERQPVSEDHAQPQQELEDLDRFIQEAETEAEVEDTETETMETVKQVPTYFQGSRHFILILHRKTQGSSRRTLR